MNKIKLKKVRKVKKSTKITIITIFIIIFVVFTIKYINKNMYPTLMKYAKADAKKIALVVLENSITNDILKILETEKIFDVSKNNNGEVNNVDFDPAVVNKVLLMTSRVVSNNLKKIEKGNISNLTFINNEDYNLKKLKNGVISELPMGLAFNNSLLSNIGPKIPVKINMIGNVLSYINTKVKNYGINNAMVIVYAHVEVEEEVIIPFNSKKIKVVNDIPIAIKIIQGTVPNYYGGSLNQKSNAFSLPINIDK